MTNQQINEAIALACGWRYEPRELIVSEISIGDDMPWIQPDGTRRRVYNLPNYCADLNAMHEAEKTLNDGLYFAYANRISEAAYRMAHGLPHVVITKNTVSATARQRAEAFLRTIGKWKEESK